MSILIVAGFVAGILGLQAPPSEIEIERLAQKLASDSFEAREEAMKKLERVGKPALDSLRSVAANGKNLETRRRAEVLIAEIEGRRITLERVFRGHTDSVWDVAFSPDGRQVLSCGRDRTARLWDVETAKELHCFEHGTGTCTLAFSPDGQRILTGTTGGTLHLWDAQTGELLHDYPRDKLAKRGGIDRVRFSPDGKQGLSIEYDIIRVWNMANFKQLKSFARSPSNPPRHIFDVLWSSRGLLAVGGIDLHRSQREQLDPEAGFLVWELETGKEIGRFPLVYERVGRFVLSPDGQKLLAAGRERLIYSWDFKSGKAMDPLAGHEDVESARGAVGISPTGRYCLTAARDQIARLWDLETGAEVAAVQSGLMGHQVAWSPDGRYLLSGSRNLHLWRLSKPRR